MAFIRDKELTEFEQLREFLRSLRSKCELQGKVFKDVIANDPNLSMLIHEYHLTKKYLINIAFRG